MTISAGRTSLSLWVHAVAVACVGSALVYIGVPMHFLDGRLYYSVSQVELLLGELGESGRARYLGNESLDLIFIGLYSSLFARLYPRTWKLAVLAAAADLVETGGIILLLLNYPAPDSRLPLLVACATPVKWTAIILWCGGYGRVLLGHHRR